MSSTVSIATTAFADLAEDAFRVAVDAVKRRPIKCRAETLRCAGDPSGSESARSCLPPSTESGEQTRRFFDLHRFGASVLRAVLLRLRSACRCLHFFRSCRPIPAIPVPAAAPDTSRDRRRSRNGNSPGKPFAQQVTRDLARLRRSPAGPAAATSNRSACCPTESSSLSSFQRSTSSAWPNFLSVRARFTSSRTNSLYFSTASTTCPSLLINLFGRCERRIR